MGGSESEITPTSSTEHAEQIVFYSIFPDSSSPDFSSNVTLYMQRLHRKIDKIIFPFIKEYIWQYEPFNLSISRLPNSNLVHLGGKVCFGNCLNDECLAIFLLFEISRRFPDVYIRVWDNRGEILLIPIEAGQQSSGLKHSKSRNRVFLHGGDIHIITKHHLRGKPSVEDSLNFIANCNGVSRASEAVQSAVKELINGYPEKAVRDMHKVRVRVPVKVAQVLKYRACSISLAVEGFYDPAINPRANVAAQVEKFAANMEKLGAAKMEKFLAKGREEELVCVSVNMSRRMYTEFTSQAFEPPECYPKPKLASASEHAEFLLGGKITCGFEMIYQKMKRQGLEEKKRISMKVFVSSLHSGGFFEGKNPQSPEYLSLMEAAQKYYYISNPLDSEFMSARLSGLDKLLSYPDCADDFKGKEVATSNDDSLFDLEELKYVYPLLTRDNEVEDYHLKHKKKLKRMRSGLDIDELNKAMEGFVEAPNNRELEDHHLKHRKKLKKMHSGLNMEGFVEGPNNRAPNNWFRPLLAVHTLMVLVAAAFQHFLAPALPYSELYLVMQCPWNICKLSKGSCVWNADKMGFTIHGMWPQLHKKAKSIHSKHGADFKGKMMKNGEWCSIKNCWPNLFISSSNMELWEHEWKRHGTDFLGDQEQYFGRAIDLYNQLKLGDAFDEIGMIKGKQYSTQTTVDRLKDITGVTCMLVCKWKNKSVDVLVEVIFCVEPDGSTLKDCTEPSNCLPDFSF